LNLKEFEYFIDINGVFVNHIGIFVKIITEELKKLIDE
jgi:hypothetical protein